MQRASAHGDDGLTAEEAGPSGAAEPAAPRGQLRREFFRGSASSLGVIVLGRALAFLSQVILARWLPTSDYGLYRYLVNAGDVVLMFTQLGVPQILVRGIASAGTRDRPELEVAGFVRASRLIYVMSALVLLGVGSVGLAVAHGRIGEQLFVSLCLLLVLTVINLLTARQSTILRGLKRVGQSLLCNLVVIPVGQIVFAAAFWLLGIVGVVPGLGVEIFAAVASLIVGHLLLRRRLGGTAMAEVAPIRGRVVELISASLPLALAAPLSQLSRYVDVLILGMFAPMSQVALYAVASRVAILGSLGLRAASPITGPLVAERFARQDLRGVERVAFLAAALSTGYALVFVSVLLIGGRRVLGLFGSEYAQAFPLLLIVCAGYLINAVVGSVDQLLIMTKHQGKYTRMLVVTVAINIALNYLLIPRYGAFGAAYATLIAQLVLCGANAVQVAYLLRINSSIFNWRIISEIDWSSIHVRTAVRSAIGRKGWGGAAPTAGSAVAGDR